MCQFVPVELCWEGQQATFKAAGKAQQVHAAGQSSAMGTESKAARVAAPVEGRLCAEQEGQSAASLVLGCTVGLSRAAVDLLAL